MDNRSSLPTRGSLVSTKLIAFAAHVRVLCPYIIEHFLKSLCYVPHRSTGSQFPGASFALFCSQGNIGTPTRVLLNLISACRLPTIALKDLGLSFVNRRSVREYGAVPYQYPVVEVQKPAVAAVPLAPARTVQSTTATVIAKHAGVAVS